ncbi:tensin-3-like isoform X1 [Synchiropus splendidus]|uniref:tensin-3-like isoform X1 n=2 Tax=Synchiropus splendidus TaxID=270530 RepID=UPI00237D3BB6|nr:tensin-3-like isoform X1 [Synchiropus splendidus]XP_053738527.1 tensin-3-like isoform X1 [Synchiropus splendidus]
MSGAEDFGRQILTRAASGMVVTALSVRCLQEGLGAKMEEGYELDLTYITERIIAVSFPRGCSEEIYAHNLKDVTRMLKSKHADNYLIINLSERRHDLSRMNQKTLDTGWPDLHAPPLDKICTICKAMESWLNADPLHVVVIHCRGGKGRIGVIISSFVHFTDVSASADQALDRFAMRKYYDDKVSALMTPSQKRYVWILNSLLSGSMKINASPLFLHCVILHGMPNFDSTGVCRPYIKVYQGMQAVYSSGVYHVGAGHRGRICVVLEPAQLLKGDIMIKCYHKSEITAERQVIFRLQFHTGAVQGYNLMFEKEDMESANKDPRFPDYGKVELVFSEGPEKIPGAERWHNGVDVVVDYNTADPLTRWDSYQNICDGEAPRLQAIAQDKATAKRTPNGGDATLARGTRTTSATSSPDHSDHALSVSSDSGLSSTSLWADKPTPVPAAAAATTAAAAKHNQGPSQKEKVQLKRLLSGFGVEDPSLEEMDDQESKTGIQQIVPAQVHINGDPRPQERETDILDDEVITGHDLHSVDSLGTLSSSCHKSSQNSLLSDGFSSPAGEEQSQHHTAGPPPMEEYERNYTDTRVGRLGSRSNSVASSNPSSASMPKQHVYRQGSYSTQSWVRQQQMVAAQQFVYMPEDGSDAERYPENKQANPLPTELSKNKPDTNRDGDTLRSSDLSKDRATLNNNNNNKRDEEFKTLTMDIDNSIDQLNQLIMDLDPTFVPISNHSNSIKRNGGTHVNGSGTKCSNGIKLRFNDSNGGTLKNRQQPAVQSSEAELTRTLSRQGSDAPDLPGFCSPGWGATDDYQRTYSPSVPKSQHALYRSDSAECRTHGQDMDSGVEAGSDMTPPTPAFPISPPTPYVKNMSEFSQLRQTPPTVQSYGGYRTDHDPRGYSEVANREDGLVDASMNYHRTLSGVQSISVVGTSQRADSSSMNQSWPEHPVLSRHSSLSSYQSSRPPLQHSMSLDYGHHSPPLHHPHIHPAPNAHSSPRSSQRSRMARYALSQSPAQCLDEQEDSGLGYGMDCPSSTSTRLGNGGMERDLLGHMDGKQLDQMQPPNLPEKKRVSDGEHSLGTASPALSGFSSPHSGSSLSIPFPNTLPDLSSQTAGTTSPLPDVLTSKQVTVKFVQDTSKFWYKPDISRDQAISVLKDKEPGCFIVRDSHSFRGAYGLAMKVATPPPSVLQQGKKGGDLSNELVRHFLIECTQKGVRLKGCPNEPYFGSLTALVCQHSITPLALPCKLIIPDRDPLEDVVDTTPQSVTNSAAELLKQGAACNVWYLGSVDMESLTGVQAVQKATTMTLSCSPLPISTVVHFKVSSQGITLTDNQRKLFFRRHYNVNTVIFCALDPQDRKWKKEGCLSAKIFGFVARKSGTSTDNVCHLFAEHDPEQPASAIVNFVSKVMIGSQKSK